MTIQADRVQVNGDKKGQIVKVAKAVLGAAMNFFSKLFGGFGGRGKAGAEDMETLKEAVQTARDDIQATQENVDSAALDQADQDLAEAQVQIEQVEEMQNATVDQNAIADALGDVQKSAASLSQELSSLVKGKPTGPASAQGNEPAKSADAAAVAQLETMTEAVDSGIDMLNQAMESGSLSKSEEAKVKNQLKQLENAKSKASQDLDKGVDAATITDNLSSAAVAATEKLEHFADKGKSTDAFKDVVKNVSQAIKGGASQTSSESSASSEASASSGASASVEVSSSSEASSSGTTSSASESLAQAASEDSSLASAVDSIQEELTNIDEAVESVNNGGDAQEAAIQVSNSVSAIEDIVEETGNQALADIVSDELAEIKEDLDPILNQATGGDVQQALEQIEDKIKSALKKIEIAEKQLQFAPDLMGLANRTVANIGYKDGSEQSSIDKIDLSGVGQQFLNNANQFSSVQANADGSVSHSDQNAMMGSTGDSHSANQAAKAIAGRYQAAQDAGLSENTTVAAEGGKRLDAGKAGGPAADAGPVEGEGEGAAAEESKAADLKKSLKSSMDKAGEKMETAREEAFKEAENEAQTEAIAEAKAQETAASDPLAGLSDADRAAVKEKATRLVDNAHDGAVNDVANKLKVSVSEKESKAIISEVASSDETAALREQQIQEVMGALASEMQGEEVDMTALKDSINTSTIDHYQTAAEQLVPASSQEPSESSEPAATDPLAGLSKEELADLEEKATKDVNDMHDEAMHNEYDKLKGQIGKSEAKQVVYEIADSKETAALKEQQIQERMVAMASGDSSGTDAQIQQTQEHYCDCAYDILQNQQQTTVNVAQPTDSKTTTEEPTSPDSGLADGIIAIDTSLTED